MSGFSGTDTLPLNSAEDETYKQPWTLLLPWGLVIRRNAILIPCQLPVLQGNYISTLRVSDFISPPHMSPGPCHLSQPRSRKFSKRTRYSSSSKTSKGLQKNRDMKNLTTGSWWLNQPNWKICSSNWIISPRIGVNIKTYLKPQPIGHVNSWTYPPTSVVALIWSFPV